jgi:hypothetical protein
MTLRFPTIASAAAPTCFLLSAVWLLQPDTLLAAWGVAYSAAAGLVARRSAALFLGLGIMFLKLRHAEASAARTALMSGFIVSCLALAALGLLEWHVGHAGAGILSAVVVELAFAASLWKIAAEDHRNGHF